MGRGGKQQLGVKDREAEAETHTGRARGALTHQGLIIVEQLLEVGWCGGVRLEEVKAPKADVTFWQVGQAS